MDRKSSPLATRLPRRVARRHARVEVALAIVLCAAAVAPGAGVSARAAAPTAATVKTSRGELELLTFAPGRPAAGRPLVLLISGEGGWRRFDDLLAGFLTDAGYWVGGLDITKYFWDAQDDRQALAADMRAYAAALASAAGRKEDSPMVLAGFSFGADLAPWVAGAGGWGDRIRGLIMIGPDETGSLQFRIMEILGLEPKDHIFSVADALASSKGIPVAFIHGEKDTKSAAPLLAPKAAEPKKMIIVAGGDHHFSGSEEKLRAALMEGLEWIAPPDKHE